MLKCVMTGVLLFGSGVCGFSENTFNDMNKIEFVDFSEQDPIVIYISSVHGFLSLGDYDLALASLKRASFLLRQSETPRDDFDFLINFYKVIAYDNLHLRDECERSLGTLIVLSRDIKANLLELEADDNDDNDDNDDDADDGLEIMLRTAELASSSDVREILINIVEDIYTK